MKASRFIGYSGAAAVALGLLVLPDATPSFAAGDTLVVSAGTVMRPVTHVASGGLYALASATVPTAAQLPRCTSTSWCSRRPAFSNWATGPRSPPVTR
jgi:hypothetical protein